MAKTFLPTLNQIRSARRGELEGYAIAEAFDQVASHLKTLSSQVDKIKPTQTTTVSTQRAASPSNQVPSKVVPSTPPSFADVTSGTNDQALMIVGGGASLDFSDTGTINASSIQGITITGTPVVGNFLRLTSAKTATWAALGMITSLDCMSSTGLIGGLDCGDLS
jgi:hypothetical protein